MDKDKLKKTLTAEEFYVTQNKGTEPPFSGKYLNNKNKGTYKCVCCGEKLFSSEHKYDSQSGWPSFYDVIDQNSFAFITDESHGMVRTEVKCGKCDSHLGHVFNDGPRPTNLRYCINSLSLKFDHENI